MRYLNSTCILLLIVLFICSACSQMTEKEIGGFEKVYFSNAENVDEENRHFKDASGGSQLYGNINTRTSEIAFSGDHCLELTPKKPYGFTTDIQNIGPDEYIQVTAWRKSKDKGIIVIDGGNGFYKGGKNVIEEKENGWSKIFIEIFTPPNFKKNSVKIFVWNNTKDTVYFDDIQIIHRHRKDYPSYEEVTGLNIYPNDQGFQRFREIRRKAYEDKVLVNSDEDYTRLVLFDGNDFLNGEFRLKGDLLDHLEGPKWSFRIKLKKDFAWRNLRTFSIQNPSTRNFMQEWVAHKIFEQEDVLTTRYGFIPVKVNNESLGIYAWEEHFEKQLVESKNRREGPIVRFNENVFWQRVIESKNTAREWDIDYFAAAKTIPFKMGQTVKDSLLSMQLVQAQNLLLQYRNRTKPMSEIFDVDKLARYYALLDITQAYHGFTWHNQRFYFNPVTCLLELIAFDGYIEGGIYKRVDEKLLSLLDPEKIKDLNKDELMLFQVFTDSTFNQKYIDVLKQYSNPEFLQKIVSKYQDESDSLANLIRLEFPHYKFNFNYLKWQAAYVKKNIKVIESNVENLGKAIKVINPEKFRKEYTSDVSKRLIPFQVHAFYNKSKNKVDIVNFHNAKVRILGAFMNDQLPESFDPRPELEAYKGIEVPKVSIQINSIPLKILFSIENEIYETEVSQWPYSNDLTPRQLLSEKRNPDNLPIVGDSVVFDGEYQFNSDVVIPAGKKVVFGAGAKIDLVKGAAFISFSSIKMNGKKGNPVQIFSSDNSANGFNILQAKEETHICYTTFEGLSSLNRSGWFSPAAVNIYESDVSIDNSSFISNSNCDDALNVVRAKFNVTNCQFKNTFADAFDSDFCEGIVKDCIFKNIGNDAIDFSGSQVNISDCEMFDIKDKAISGGEKSTLFVENCEIDKANIGVASKDLSSVVLDKIKLKHTAYGLIAFVKKPEFGPASITINNLKMENNVIFHQIEEGSVLSLNGKIMYGREKKIALKLYQ